MRRAAKTDTNQRAMIGTLRKLGFSVKPTHTIGRGFPDLVVAGRCGKCFDFHTLLVEIKRDAKAKLTADQVKFRNEWRGHIIVATDASEVSDGLRAWCCG